MSSDRITGLVLLGLALLYGFGAARLKAGFGSGPLGPRGFPLLLAVCLGLVAIGIFFKNDISPERFKASSFLNLMIVSASFLAYAYLLVPVGFIAATTLETGFVSQRFGAKLWQAALTGLVASLAMYALFVYALGIPLPTGRIFGGR